MQTKLQIRNKRTLRRKILIILTVLACGGMLTLSYAQSSGGSAFNLNSPASFPVDI